MAFSFNDSSRLSRATSKEVKRQFRRSNRERKENRRENPQPIVNRQSVIMRRHYSRLAIILGLFIFIIDSSIDGL